MQKYLKSVSPLVALGVIVAALASAPVAGARQGSSLSLQGAAVFGGQVTFAVSTSATYPWVDAKCSQNGQVVYEQWAGFYASYAGSQVFSLGPTELWAGSWADCSAVLISYDRNGSPHTLATARFSVAG